MTRLNPLAIGCASSFSLTRDHPFGDTVLQELLRPRIIRALGDACAPAKLGDGGFAAQALEYNSDLLFGRVVLPSCPPDVANKRLG